MSDVVASSVGVHAALLWACVLAALAVFALMIHSFATCPRTDSARKRGAFSEVLWALIPIAIVIATAAPAAKSLLDPQGSTETAQQARHPTGPELAGEIPQKAFNEGGIPL